jgi:hypothetical protein
VQGFSLSTDALWSAQQAADAASGLQHAAGEQRSRAGFEEGLAVRIRELLGANKTMSPAVALLLQLRGLAAAHFDREAVSGQLLGAGQLGLAIRWASELGPSFQVDSYYSAAVDSSICLTGELVTCWHCCCCRLVHAALDYKVLFCRYLQAQW